jgi:5,10-methylenetetrahydromethanopterin reductase
VTLRGRDVLVENVRLSQVPVAVPRLLVGVRGPKALALAGEVGDWTILAEPAMVEYLRSANMTILAGGPHRIVAYNVAAVRMDRSSAIDAARAGLHYIGEPDWSPHLEPLGIGADIARLRKDCVARAEFAQRMPAEWVERLALNGTPETVRARIRELHDNGASSVVMSTVGPNWKAELDLLAMAR